MAVFRFELETVLRLRRREERDHQREVAGLERERLAIEERIRRIQRAIVSGKQVLREALSRERIGDESAGTAGGVDVVDLPAVRFQAGASLHLVAKAQEAVLALAGVHARLDRARLGLLDASRRRRAMELLRDRRYERWRREQDRRERLELDEIVVMRAGRTEDRQ